MRSSCSAPASTTACRRRSLRRGSSHALVLYNEGVASYIVTVGGKQPGDNYTEAESGATYLHQHGVPRSALVALQTGT